MDNYIIYIDTREQQISHLTKKWIQNDIKFKRKKLDYGDYSFQYNGRSFEKKIVIERKYCINEFALCVYGKRRLRLKQRMIEAQKDKAIFILLIENASIEMIKNHSYKGIMPNGQEYGKIHPNCILGAIESWKKKHGIYVTMILNNMSSNYIHSCFSRYIRYYNSQVIK